MTFKMFPFVPGRIANLALSKTASMNFLMSSVELKPCAAMIAEAKQAMKINFIFKTLIDMKSQSININNINLYQVTKHLITTKAFKIVTR